MTTNTSTPISTPSQVWQAVFFVAILVLAALSGHSAMAAQGALVGEVTLTIGRASIERPDTPLSDSRRGLSIFEGDVVRTSSSGHVHIKFVDGALVSVRPDSVFRIQAFKYNPADPAASTVLLSLESGEVRSISGAAAKAARERFRLNTPLVAIGVKGTDFVTRSSGPAVSVTVNEGAIVMAPFDQACRIDALGTCGGSRARELSAAMGELALVYNRGAVDPSFQPAGARPGGGPTGVNDSVKIQSLERQSKENSDAPVRSTQVVSETRDPLGVISASRMVWGRWANDTLPGDALTVPFLDALRGNEVTVGDGYYFLFREPGVANLLPSLNTKIDFSLQGSAANYRLENGDVVAASVQSATLGIDFGARTFSTTLTASAEPVGNHTFSYRGNINPQTGIFLAPATSPGDASLAGALALDATRAGFLFFKPVGTGSFMGSTIWGRGP